MEPATLSQRVYEQIHQRLRSGKLRPGTRLVNRRLAADLGTSTIPVREAIGRLVSEGLLESSAGAGAFVRTPEPNELAELYDVREALEVLAAGEVARFASDSLILELRAVCGLFRRVAATIPTGKHASRLQFDRWLDAEEQFHNRLIAASRNRWLVKTVRGVRVIARVFAAHRLAPKLLSRVAADATVRHHEKFLDILAARDVEKARAWVTAHIRTGRETVLGHFTSGKTTNGTSAHS